LKAVQRKFALEKGLYRLCGIESAKNKDSAQIEDYGLASDAHSSFYNSSAFYARGNKTIQNS
jgi:hypothetical protein